MRRFGTPQEMAPVSTLAGNPVPPYVPYRTFRNFVDSLKQAIPSRIDRSVMPSMSGALQGQLTAALKYLGLISDAGHPTSALSALVNSEGAERAKALRTVLVAAYPFLFDEAKFDLTAATPRLMQEQFEHAGAGGGTIAKCINFFLAAAKDADVMLSPHITNGRGTRGPWLRRISRATIEQVHGAMGPIAMNGDDVAPPLSWSQMLLSKFPSFDPAWPDEVKVKWFDGFHRLMRMKLEEEKEP
jgi:hypothetical protein